MARPSTNTIKKRNWGGVVYPESAPEDWKEILKLKGVTFAVSPLHDKDIDDEVGGKPKKPHYHIILCYGSPTTYNNVKALMDELNQPIPIALESVRGYYRYFTHKDNPDKYQYDEKGIETYNGFDVTDVLNNFEVFRCLKMIQEFIIEYNILEYSELMDDLLDHDEMELWNVACSHTTFLNAYIKSKKHLLKEANEML